MLEMIEKLLVLQDRDRKIRRLQSELDHIEPERSMIKTKTHGAQTNLENAKTRVKQLESDRKALELEVESKKGFISKYANQQLQTRKNEEYQALAHEIETCKSEIIKLEDQQLELMEKTETVQKQVVAATGTAKESQKMMEDQLVQLAARENSLKQDLASLKSNREELASAVDSNTRARYERLVRNKGESVVVGVQHGVCGGCHMRLPAQVLVSCQAQMELTSCTNCGRILYYTPDMDLAVAE